MATLTVSVFEQIQIACRPRASGSKFVAQYAAQITARARLLARIPAGGPESARWLLHPAVQQCFCLFVLFSCSQDCFWGIFHFMSSRGRKWGERERRITCNKGPLAGFVPGTLWFFSIVTPHDLQLFKRINNTLTTLFLEPQQF